MLRSLRCKRQPSAMNFHYTVHCEVPHEFEQRAAARGRTFYLETFSFQAPSLYRALGYEVKLDLRGCAPGIVKYSMVHEAG